MKIKQFPCGNSWAKIFRNKCCICGLICFTLVIIVVITAKLFINSLLYEIENESFNSSAIALKEGVDEKTIEGENLMETLFLPRDLAEEFPHTFAGFDYKDQPVWIVPFGKWDVRKVLTANDENEDRMKYWTEMGVKRALESLKFRNSSKVVVIADLNDYSYWQIASYRNIAFQLQIVLKYQPMFDILDYGFAVNMDYFSELALGIIKPLVSSILPRIQLIGHDEQEYISEILKKIPPSQLPPEYGGTKDYKPIKVFN